MTSGRRCCIARLMRNNPFRAAYRELSDAQSQTSWPSTNVVGATIRREEYVPGRHWTLRIDLFNEFFKGLRFPLNISSRADANRNFGHPKFPTPTSPEHPNFARPKFSRIHIPASLRPQAPRLLLRPVLRTRLWMSKEPMGPIGPGLLRGISACALGTRFLKWTTPWCVHCYVPPPAHKKPVNFGHPKPLKAAPEEADFERPKSHWSSPRGTHPHRKHFGRPKSRRERGRVGRV